MRMKESGLHLVKGGCHEVISNFVAARTDVIPSFSLTYAEGGMASTGSESVSSF